MATGSQFAAFNNKQLIGYQDLGVRGLAALRASHIEATAARWDVDGVFNTKLTLSSPGASQVQVNGTSKATDGLGHVITVSSAYKSVAQFQNSGAVVYHVGLMYAEVPTGLRINPRTGKPQYDRYTEEVGFAGVPTSVTDNGNGTITFNVNSVTEAGVSNAGRLVRVYKLIPADGATTFDMAVEECTVAFGANNTITTVGKFGQTTVSTTAGDYVVVCMGPRVSRNTDLSTVTGVVYIGTVTGNGGTPVTFSNTNQTLLKTFQDATQITYTPAGWLAPGATTVQLALDALVNGLQASTPSGAAAGGARIGMYAPDWTAVASGGIGNVADSTYTTSATLTDLGKGVDTAIRRRQTFQTKNDGGTTNADDSSGTSVGTATLQSGRPQWLRTLANAATTPYALAADVSVGAGQSSYLMGEFADLTQANAELRRTRISASGGQRAVSGGKWQRLWLDAAAGSYYRFGGSGQRSGLILEDSGINGGALLIDGCASTSNQDWGFNFRNSIVVPKAETTKAWSATVRYGAVTSAFVWSVWENVLVYGPSATQTTPAGAGYALLINSQITGPINAATVAAQSRPFVFRDCVFIMQRTTDIQCVLISGDHPVLFENCRFFGIAGHAAGSTVTAGAASNVTMRDCIVFDPEGMCIDFAPTNGLSGLMDNVVMVAGVGGSGTPTAPFPCWVNGNVFGVSVNDCTILLGSSVWRSNATATTTPLVKFGNASQPGNTLVKNLTIKVEGGTDLGWARLVDVVGQAANSPGCLVDGLSFNANGAKLNTTATNTSYMRFSACSIDHLTFVNLTHDAGGTGVNIAYTELAGFTVARGWALNASTNLVANSYCRAAILISGNSNTLRDVFLGVSGNWNCQNGIFEVSGSNNLMDGVKADTTIVNSFGFANVSLVNNSGNENVFTHFDVTCTHTGTARQLFSIGGRDNMIESSQLKYTTAGDPGTPGIVISTGRRNRVIDCDMHWNGTTQSFISSTSPDALFDSLVFYRSAGATAAINSTGAGAVTGSIVTSTTL